MDFSKVTNFFSDLLGNPFSTPVGQLIEKATDVSQASEDWALYMEICDVINSTEDGPQDAARALKKLITNNVGKSNIAIMYTLTVLETCVKNCGMRFHIYVAEKEFLQELVKLAMPRNNPPHFVLDKVLGLIQTWADAFRGESELKEFVAVYEELKEKGCEFPMTDLDNIPPIHTPARSVPAVQPVTHSETPPASQGQLPSVGSVAGGPVVLDVEQLAKLRSELDVVQQNCHVFSEMLTEQTPGQEQPDDWALMQELNAACHTMQKRIMELIEQVQNEDVTAELLHVNDQLNNVALRYERYERMHTGGASAAATSQSQDASAPPYPLPSSVTKSPATDGIQTGTLVDLGSATSASSQLTGPAAEVNGQASVPTSKPSEEDFDMFAQSRQSFEENLPRVNRGAYQDQEEDQALSGLAAAVTMKSRGVTYKMDESPKETASSSEFDAFLATREKEANSAPSDSSAASNRGGRTLQTAEEEQALFSL